MISLATGLRVYLACGTTDMRKGMAGLAMLVQQTLSEDPFGGAVFAFRGRRAGLIKLIWHDGIGLCMLTRRLEQGQFAWPSASTTGRITLSSAQLAALLDGCEWRAPAPRRRPGSLGKNLLFATTNSGTDAVASCTMAPCRSTLTPCRTMPPCYSRCCVSYTLRTTNCGCCSNVWRATSLVVAPNS